MCPKCYSEEVIYDEDTGEYVCIYCGYTWKAERRREEVPIREIEESILRKALRRWRAKEPEENFTKYELLLLLKYYADKDDYEDAGDVASALSDVYGEEELRYKVSDVKNAIYSFYEELEKELEEERKKVREIEF
jgi:transcription initiation factor TFIIIB Brf1 subunit/transcription initiation factor TFIIB